MVRLLRRREHLFGAMAGRCHRLRTLPRQRQITIHLSGGIAEAIHRGERRPSEVLRFATLNCDVDDDLKKERTLLIELRRLTGVDHTEQRCAERALALLLENWGAVEALASALIQDRRIEGKRVERIIDAALIWCASRTARM